MVKKTVLTAGDFNGHVAGVQDYEDHSSRHLRHSLRVRNNNGKMILEFSAAMNMQWGIRYLRKRKVAQSYMSLFQKKRQRLLFGLDTLKKFVKMKSLEISLL